MGKIIAILIAAFGLLLPLNTQAGPWTSLTTKYVLPSKPPLKPSPDLRTSACTHPTPYRWSGQCLACTNPSSDGLERTGYVRCDEGFCTNSGLVAFARVFGATGTTVDVRDCASVPAPAPRETAETTHFGLGTEEYVIGTVAATYPGQQLGSIKCDPGQVAVGMRMRADSVIRAITELVCKPINGLGSTSVISKPAAAGFGNFSTPHQTDVVAPVGHGLVGFDMRFTNSFEYDNRLGELVVLSPVRLDPATGVVANEPPNPEESPEQLKIGTADYPHAGNPSIPTNPWIRAKCPEKHLMTGVWVLYDNDSLKSVTPTCQRVYAPGEAIASVPEGRFGLSQGSEVGYLGGRNVSNAVIAGGPYYVKPYAFDMKCPEGAIMVGWRVRSDVDGYIDYFGQIYCQDIGSVAGSCTDGSAGFTSPPPGPLTVATYEPDYRASPYNADDLGRQGCAMVGFDYKQQKSRRHVRTLPYEQPPDTQVVAELHSLVSDRDQAQTIQGRNFGLGHGANHCWPQRSAYNCNTTDWWSVRCPTGSFMVGVKGLHAGQGMTALAAYCREAVEGPWTEASDPAPGPAALRVAPVQVDVPTLVKPLVPAQ